MAVVKVILEYAGKNAEPQGFEQIQNIINPLNLKQPNNCNTVFCNCAITFMHSSGMNTALQ